MNEVRPDQPSTPPRPATSPVSTGDDTILAQGSAELKLAQELRLHRIELEVQHEQLRSTQDELEAARDRFADLYELAPVAFFTTTAHGVIVELNGAGAWLIERPRAQAVGLPLAVAGGLCTTAFLAHLRACVASPTPVTVELDLVPPSSRRCRVQLTSRSVRGPGGERLCLIAVTDVSAHQRAEDRLRLQAGVGASLLAATAVPEAVKHLTRALVPTVADLCVLDLVLGAGELRRGVGSCHVDPAKGDRFEDAERRWGALPNVGFATLQALQTRRSQLLPKITPKYYETAAVDDAHFAALVGLALRSWAVVPLLDPYTGQPIGVFRLAVGGVRPPLDAEDLAIAEQVAQLGAWSLAGASSRVSLLAEAAARAERGRALVRSLEEALRSRPGGGRAGAKENADVIARAHAALTDLKALFNASHAHPRGPR